MKTFYQLSLAASLIGVASGLSSCSKELDVQPTSQIAAIQANVRIVDGRLVFADQKAFEQVSNQLREMGSHVTNSQELGAWEKSLHFTSLRSAAAAEEVHLEELDSQNMPALAHVLMDKFGFPQSYAALISPAGEYQIGDKVYWFHDGFKYQANSEEELLAIKLNPSSAKTKYQAGTRIIEGGKLSAKGQDGRLTSNFTTRNNNPFADDKYSSYFYYRGDTGSQRRTIYAVSVYTEDRGVDGGYYWRTFYTHINLFIKYEYYSRGSSKWYQAGDSFDWNTLLHFTGNVTVPDQVSSAHAAPGQSTGSTQYFNNTLKGNYTNGFTSIELGWDDLRANVAFNDKNASQVVWSFEITGGIDGTPTYDTAHRYVVGTIYDDVRGTRSIMW